MANLNETVDFVFRRHKINLNKPKFTLPIVIEMIHDAFRHQREENKGRGLSKEALRTEIWNMLNDEAKAIMLPIKETYLDSIMEDIEDYAKQSK